MKVRNIQNIDAFFHVIDQCRGDVLLVTGEGDRLNLKSKLSQYVSLAKVFATKGEIPELELRHGNNTVSITSEGNVTFVYREGRL